MDKIETGHFALTEKEWRVDSSAGALLARSVVPDARPAMKLAIFHGYGDHSGCYLHVMRWMAARGVACHAIDFRGHGDSPGRRGYVHSWDEYLDDVDALLGSERLASEPVPLFVLGHSHGALVLTAAALRGRLDSFRIRGLIFSAPYYSNGVPVPLHKKILSRVGNILLPWIQIPSGIQPDWLTSDPRMKAQREQDDRVLRTATPRWFVTMQRAQQEVMSHPDDFRCPMLMLVAGADPVASPIAAEQFFKTAGSPDKSFQLFPDMVHEVLREKDHERVLQVISDWMNTRAQGVLS